MLRYVLTGLFVLCLGSASAAELKKFSQVPGEEYREQIDPTIPVSGLALVGFALAGPIDLEAKVLHVFFSQPFSGRLNLEITSANGRFRAQAMYEGRSDGNEWIALSIEPRNADRQARRELIKSNPADLAVTARPVTEKGTILDTVLQVSWGPLPDAKTDRKLKLYVNSRRADMFVRAPGLGKAKACTPLRIPNAVRFDTVCEIAWQPALAKTLPEAQSRLQLIRRDGFDESQQRISVY